jgi:hypothetical protein
MSGDWYTPSGSPGTSSDGSSQTIRDEFDLIETAIDKLPTLTGNGDDIVVINTAGTAMETQSITGDVVGTNNTQTLTNKSLVDATTYFVDDGDNTKKVQLQVSGVTTATTRTLTVPDASDTLVLLAEAQTLTNKTLTAPIISTISNTGTLTLPTSTDTLVGKATTDTLTNKTLTAPVLNGALSGTSFIDDDTMATASATTVSSSESVQAYANSVAAAQGPFRFLSKTSLTADDIEITLTSGYDVYRVDFYGINTAASSTSNFALQVKVSGAWETGADYDWHIREFDSNSAAPGSVVATNDTVLAITRASGGNLFAGHLLLYFTTDGVSITAAATKDAGVDSITVTSGGRFDGAGTPTAIRFLIDNAGDNINAGTLILSGIPDSL